MVFPDPRRAGRREILAVGVDFSAGTLLSAYRRGILPWPETRSLVPWCSPDPRAVFPIDEEPHWSRSLRRTLRKHPWRIAMDTNFEETMRVRRDAATKARGLRRRPRGHAYNRCTSSAGRTASRSGPRAARSPAASTGSALADCSPASPCSTSAPTPRRSRSRPSSRGCGHPGFALFDVQVMNDHLASLGCTEIRRAHYLDRLAAALAVETRPLIRT